MCAADYRLPRAPKESHHRTFQLGWKHDPENPHGLAVAFDNPRFRAPFLTQERFDRAVSAGHAEDAHTMTSCSKSQVTHALGPESLKAEFRTAID